MFAFISDKLTAFAITLSAIFCLKWSLNWLSLLVREVIMYSVIFNMIVNLNSDV